MTERNLLHGNRTDVHNGFNNENHGNATHSAQFTLIKFEPVHSMKAHRKRRGVTPLILNLGTDRVCGQPRALVTLPQRETKTSYPLSRRLGAPGAVKSLTWNTHSFCTFKHRTRYILLAPNFSSKKC